MNLTNKQETAFLLAVAVLAGLVLVAYGLVQLAAWLGDSIIEHPWP